MPRHLDRLLGTFEERCHAQADAKRAQAVKLPLGLERDALIADARQINVAANLEKWIASSGLKYPS